MKIVGRLVLIACFALMCMFNCSGGNEQDSKPWHRAVIEDGKYQELEKARTEYSYIGLDLTAADLRLLRNTIMARYGYEFESSDLQEHFSGFKWYKPDPENTKAIKRGQLLTKTDRANIEMIKDLETFYETQERRKDETFESMPVQVGIRYCLGMDDGEPWRLFFKPDGSIDFSSNWEAMLIEGRWEWSESGRGIVVHYTVTRLEYEDEMETSFKDEPESVEEFGPLYLTRVSPGGIVYLDESGALRECTRPGD